MLDVVGILLQRESVCIEFCKFKVSVDLFLFFLKLCEESKYFKVVKSNCASP